MFETLLLVKCLVRIKQLSLKISEMIINSSENEIRRRETNFGEGSPHKIGKHTTNNE